MIRIIVAFSLLLSGCSSRKLNRSDHLKLSRNHQDIPAPKEESVKKYTDWRKLHFQNGCAVFDIRNEVKIFPGQICIFLEDGTFISAGETGLIRFNRDKTIMWESPGTYHHQINLSVDKKRILGLMTENTVRGKNVERDDVFVVQDLESGKIIHRMLAWNILSENKIVPLNWRDTKALKELKADLETSHFNSIYEIPVNEGEKKATYLKSGNIIVNSLMLGTFILSPDLKQTHYHRVIPNSLRHNIHDVQVTKDGEFLYFNNIVDDLEEKYFFSAIDRYDPVTNKLSFTYTSNPKAFFFSVVGGGVQQVDDDLLFFSHVMEGGFLYSLKQNKVIFAAQGTNGNIYVQKGTLQIKMIDFRNFLKNHGN